MPAHSPPADICSTQFGTAHLATSQTRLQTRCQSHQSGVQCRHGGDMQSLEGQQSCGAACQTAAAWLAQFVCILTSHNYLLVPAKMSFPQNCKWTRVAQTGTPYTVQHYQPTGQERLKRRAWRPPWLLTTMPSTPAFTACSASAGASTPCRMPGSTKSGVASAVNSCAPQPSYQDSRIGWGR